MEKFDQLLVCNFTEDVNIDSVEIEDSRKNKVELLWKCDWLSLIKTANVIKFIENNLDGEFEGSEYDILVAAEAFLFAFIQQNFIGPNLSEEYHEFIKSTWPKNINTVKQLSVDGEELNVNVIYPEFLLAAKSLLQKLDVSANSKLIFKWWKIRCLLIHQNCLDELANSLYEEFCSLVNSISEYIEQIGIGNNELEMLIIIEIAQMYITFHHVKKSEKILEQNHQKLGIKINVEGLLGYRTKFQQNPLPQLCLKTVQNDKGQFLSSKDTNGSTELPKLLKLDDEIRLEKIKFVEDKDNVVMNIQSILQALILTQTKYLLKSQPKDRLSDEMLEPYLTTLLYQEHGPLNVRLTTLLLNIKQESNHKRTVERSLKQCEEVLNIVNGSKYSVKERLSYGFASFLIPKWDIQKQLGDLMISLGLVKTALDLYIEIQAWENVIECYTRLDLRHKAAEVIRSELKKKETVKLYCLLGDATDDPSHYETAWKLSNETSGIAQRHWGSYYFAKKQYEKAIPHLQKSVEINSLQEVMWLRLGYAALTLEKWDIAAQAYLRYTHIEPNGFESWNNLSKALIKLGDKNRAHKILHEALKCNFNNWKIWENLMIVSIDTGNFEDAINAYNKLIELKKNEKFLDLEILEILVKAIQKNLPDSQGRPTERLRKKIKELLAHQCAMYINEPKLWKLSATIEESSLVKAQKLQNSYRSYTQKDFSWSQKLDTCIKIMNLCKDICEYTWEAVVLCNDESEKSRIKSQLSSTRLCVQGCVRAVENNNKGNMNNEIKSLLEELKVYLEKMEELRKGM